MKVTVLGARLAQAFTAGTVLGLSITAIKWQAHGAAPPQTGFSAFTGAIGLIAVAIGVASVLTSVVPDSVIVAADGLAVACFAIAGIMRGINCSTGFANDDNGKLKEAAGLFDGGYSPTERFGLPLTADG
ncbi:hypothetical protein LTR95_014657 [Oleoguttula sp. CCFEE 5521]